MSYAECLISSVVRALVVAVLATLLARVWVRENGEQWRSTRALWWMCFVPLLPVLYVYVQRCFPPRSALGAEAWSVGLQTLKFAPWAALSATCLPPPSLRSSALFLDRLAPADRAACSRWTVLRFGRERRLVLAGLFAFAIALQEFEASSLLGRPAWTVWLFDAQVGGLDPWESARFALAAAILTLLCFSVWLAAVPRAEPRSTAGSLPSAPPPRGWSAVLRALCLAAFVFVPAAVLAASCFALAFHDLRSYLMPFVDQWWATIAFASTAAWCAARLARVLCACSLPVQMVCLLPGACGALFLALAVQRMFLTPLLRGLYDTPLPLLVTWILWLLPFAWLLERVLRERTRGTAAHSAELLRSGDEHQRRSALRVQSELFGNARFAAIVLLFSIAAFEVPASALLAPTSFTPAAVRLYNLMHYGGSTALSILLAATVMVLLGFAAGAALVRAAALRRGSVSP